MFVLSQAYSLTTFIQLNNEESENQGRHFYAAHHAEKSGKATSAQRRYWAHQEGVLVNFRCRRSRNTGDDTMAEESTQHTHQNRRKSPGRVGEDHVSTWRKWLRERFEDCGICTGSVGVMNSWQLSTKSEYNRVVNLKSTRSACFWIPFA